jgi:hypothetical protein
MLPTKPIPDCLRNGGRQHDDPVEDIQRGMGGMPWFFEVGARCIHRIGLFAGLGWMLPVTQCRQPGVLVNGCKVVKTKQPGNFYTMEVGAYELFEDVMVAPTWKTLHHRTSVHWSKLKDAYAELLTEAGVVT